jgi:hypothetical protein
MVLTRRGSTNLKEVGRNGGVHVLGDSFAKGLILNAGQFVGKHGYQFLSVGLSLPS